MGTILNTGAAAPGYTLFAPLGSTTTYLIDLDGRIVNTWESAYRPGDAVYLLENGDLLRTGNVGGQPGTFGVAGGSGGIIERYDWEGNLLWKHEHVNAHIRQHHDAIELPNGNVLLIAWELIDSNVAVQFGRDPSLIPPAGLWSDYLMEIKPIGDFNVEVVWEWHAVDHLVQDFDDSKPFYGVVADHPEKISANYLHGRLNSDWFHVNGIDYNEELDQIVLSVPTFNEIWVIDHSTTSQQAEGSSGGNSGKGGDLLYRWGNPEAYNAGRPADQKLFFQHNPTWIPEGYPGAGNILIYNNGQNRPDGDYSSVVEIAPPVNEQGAYTLVAGSAYGPAQAVWEYTAPNPEDFYSQNISGAGRLQNGNTLICEGASGHFFEVTSSGEVVWEYINPVTMRGVLEQGQVPGTGQNGNTVFRAERYALTYSGFAGRDLTPGDFIELYPSSVQGWQSTEQRNLAITVSPNPLTKNSRANIYLPTSERITVSLVDSRGRMLASPIHNEHRASGNHTVAVDLTPFPTGRYLLYVETESGKTIHVPVVW